MCHLCICEYRGILYLYLLLRLISTIIRHRYAVTRWRGSWWHTAGRTGTGGDGGYITRAWRGDVYIGVPYRLSLTDLPNSPLPLLVRCLRH